jgi:hypothetical protein
MNQYRTYTCNQISLEDVGKKVRIAGFVQTVRDLGGVVFLDIRDMYGITQVVTSGTPEEVDFAAHIPAESSVTVYGEVRKRDEETVNNKIDTGLVEIKIEEVTQGVWRWHNDLHMLRDYILNVAYPNAIILMNEVYKPKIRSLIFSENINEIGLNEHEKEYILLAESVYNSNGDKNIAEEIEMLDAFLNSLGYEISSHIFENPLDALPFAMDLEKYVPEGEIGMGGFLYDVIYGKNDDEEDAEEDNEEE